jgi:hypothetical protein
VSGSPSNRRIETPSQGECRCIPDNWSELQDSGAEPIALAGWSCHGSLVVFELRSGVNV